MRTPGVRKIVGPFFWHFFIFSLSGICFPAILVPIVCWFFWNCHFWPTLFILLQPHVDLPTSNSYWSLGQGGWGLGLGIQSSFVFKGSTWSTLYNKTLLDQHFWSFLRFYHCLLHYLWSLPRSGGRSPGIRNHSFISTSGSYVLKPCCGNKVLGKSFCIIQCPNHKQSLIFYLIFHCRLISIRQRYSCQSSSSMGSSLCITVFASPVLMKTTHIGSSTRL